MIFGLIIFLGFSLFLYLWSKKHGDWKVSSALIGGWAIKCLAACAFFYVYSEIYGKGKLSEDAGAYIEEAAILNTIYKDNPNDYYNLIFNKHDFETTIIHYFENIKISRIGPPAFLINDTRNQIKLISLISLLIGEEVFTLFAFFCLLSFIGLLVLWRSLVKKTSMNPIVVFLFLVLPISLLFWTSSPLKESTSLFGLQLLFAAYIENNKTLRWILVGAIGLIFTLLFKPYIFVILVLGWLVVQLYVKLFNEKKLSYAFTVVALIILASYYSLPKKVMYAVSDKQFDFVNVARGGVHMEGDTCYYFLEKKNRSKIEIRNSMVHVLIPVQVIAIEKGKIRREQFFTLYPNKEKLRFEYEQFGGSSFFKTKAIDRKWINLLLAIPQAISNTFLRPFPWTGFISIQNILLTLENLFYLFLFYQILRKKNQIINMKIKELIHILLVSSFLFAIVIGLTTPISGAIVRYRIPIHLFLLISFILTQKHHGRKT
jgi:hypothetical protein